MGVNGIIVRKYSFCRACSGRGCPQCKGVGTTSELIPLESLHRGMRYEYARAQKDFIQEQREELKEGGE